MCNHYKEKLEVSRRMLIHLTMFLDENGLSDQFDEWAKGKELKASDLFPEIKQGSDISRELVSWHLLKDHQIS